MYDIFLTVRRHSVILEICLKRIPVFTIILFILFRRHLRLSDSDAVHQTASHRSLQGYFLSFSAGPEYRASEIFSSCSHSPICARGKGDSCRRKA